MDKIFYNGKISTLDNQDSFAEAIGVEDGKITFIGTTQEALNLEADVSINLKGKLMLPGFVDSHLHMLNYAFVEKSVKLFACKSVDDILSEIAQTLDNSKVELNWIYARGWNETSFENPTYPTKTQLDKISEKIPVIAVRVCGHIAVTNSRGLELLQKIPQYKDIEEDVDLETGLIKENAVQFFYSILDAPTEETIKEYISFSAGKLNEKGITSIQSDDLASLPGKKWIRVMAGFKNLAETQKLNVRMYEQCLFERFEDLKDFLADGYRTGQQTGNFTIGPIKLIQDGSLGAMTAALNEPYEASESNRGTITFEQDELNQIVELCDANHMQIAVHCIGDRAMDMALESFESSSGMVSNPKNRHGIVHAQITNESILKRMKKDEVIAYIQPVFVDLDMDTVETRIGRNRMDKIYAWKSMLDMGINTCGGSDAPVVSFDIMENIYFAVTRRNIKGEPKAGWKPEERLSVSEAIKLFTKYPAYASYSEAMAGTIEVGKYADFVVLSENIYEIPEERIKDVEIVETILGGKTVYKGK